MNELTPIKAGEIIEAVIARGDIAQLSPQERAKYYVRVCESIGLNPMSRPFEYITLNSKLTLYARKDCTDQLRTMHDVSVTDLIESERDGVFIVTAKVKNAKGRTDASKGAVNIKGLQGEALANALMKAETKAKRRATLSICGLGFLDETEVEDIADKVVHEPPTPPEPPAIEARIEAEQEKLEAVNPTEVIDARPAEPPSPPPAKPTEKPPGTDALGGKPGDDPQTIPPGLRRAKKTETAPAFKIDAWLKTLASECADKTPAQLLDIREKMVEPLRDRLGHDGYNRAGDVMGAALDEARRKYEVKLDPDAWLRDLDGALSGCTDAAQVFSVVEKIQKPAAEKVPREHYARGKKLVAEALVRIAGED